MSNMKKAFLEAMNEQQKQERAEMQNIPVPEDYKEDVQRLLAIDQMSKPKPTAHRGRKLAISILAAVLLISIVAVSATAFFNPLQRIMEAFHIKDFGKGSDITYSENYGGEGWLDGTYTFIPSGFKLETNETDNVHQWLVYKNNKGDELISETLLVEDAMTTLNTEDGSLEEIRIGNAKGQYLNAKNNYQEIQWVTGKYLNSLSVENNAIDKETLIQMAESRTQS